MCGIVGFTGSDSANFIEKMNHSQRHRGPDGGGVFSSNQFAFKMAMRRLAIIDLADGVQPMSTVDKKIWVVYNGEIFNAPDLRLELIRAGAKFQTDHSDTEVLLHGYKIWGKEFIKRLNGMFAFCLYDENLGTLFGARDRMGIKPFVYSLRDGRFSFASEEKSLLQLPWISKSIDDHAVSHFFSFQAIPAPMTIYRDIEKLPAAHAWEFNLKNKSFKKWSY